MYSLSNILEELNRQMVECLDGRFENLRLLGIGLVNLMVLILASMVSGITESWIRCLTCCTDVMTFCRGLVSTVLDKLRKSCRSILRFWLGHMHTILERFRELGYTMLDRYIATKYFAQHWLGVAIAQVRTVRFPAVDVRLVAVLLVLSTVALVYFAVDLEPGTGFERLAAVTNSLNHSKNALGSRFERLAAVTNSLNGSKNALGLKFEASTTPTDYYITKIPVILEEFVMTHPTYLVTPITLSLACVLGFALHMALRAATYIYERYWTRTVTCLDQYWSSSKNLLVAAGAFIASFCGPNAALYLSTPVGILNWALSSIWSNILYGACQIRPIFQYPWIRRIRIQNIGNLSWAQHCRGSPIFTGFAVLGLSGALWCSNRDFLAVLSKSITSAIDTQFHLHRLIFVCVEYATRFCIGLAQRLITFHEWLENLTYNEGAWFWVTSADVIDACACSAVVVVSVITLRHVCYKVSVSAMHKQWFAVSKQAEVEGSVKNGPDGEQIQGQV